MFLPLQRLPLGADTYTHNPNIGAVLEATPFILLNASLFGSLHFGRGYEYPSPVIEEMPWPLAYAVAGGAAAAVFLAAVLLRRLPFARWWLWTVPAAAYLGLVTYTNDPPYIHEGTAAEFAMVTGLFGGVLMALGFGITTVFGRSVGRGIVLYLSSLAIGAVLARFFTLPSFLD